MGKPRITEGTEGENGGRYLYCVVEDGEKIIFGKIGIDGNEVRTIAYKDISAVVHNCPAEPYQSEDEETVKGWVMTHEDVVEVAWKKTGTVLPLRFDTIIKGSKGLSAEETLKKWLRNEYENLKGKLKRFRNKGEVAVQVLWDPKVIARKITETDEEIRKLTEEMSSKSRGMAYFYKQKIERALKKEIERKADEYFKDFYGRIRKYAIDIRIEKTKREEGKQMLMNLSVLINREKIKSLGRELAKIKAIKGLDVRFTGPWPPYSFVTPG